MIAHQEAERKKNKHKQLTALKTSGQVDIPEHLLPTPLQISTTPTPYPLHICNFNKLFWQTSTNVKFDVYRLVSTYKHNTIFQFSRDPREPIQGKYYQFLITIITKICSQHLHYTFSFVNLFFFFIESTSLPFHFMSRPHRSGQRW